MSKNLREAIKEHIRMAEDEHNNGMYEAAMTHIDHAKHSIAESESSHNDLLSRTMAMGSYIHNSAMEGMK